LTRSLFLKLVTCLWLILALSGLAGAQQADGPQALLAAVGKQVDEIGPKITAKADDDGELVKLKVQLDDLAQQVIGVAVSFRPRMGEINKRLAELGPAATDADNPEPQTVQDERKKLAEEKKAINSALGGAEDMSIKVNRQIDLVSQRRRDLFSSSLSQRVDVNYAFGSEVIKDAQKEAASLLLQFKSWWQFVWKFKFGSILAAAFFALLAALVILIGGRRVFASLYSRDGEIAEPSYLSRLSVGFWSTLIPSVSFAVFLAATYFFFDYFNVLRSDIRPTVSAIFYVCAVVFFIHRLAHGILSPDMPNWRLIRVAPGPGRILLWLITATALVTGLDFIGEVLNRTLDSPLPLTIAKSLLATILVGFLIVVIALVNPVPDDKGGRPQPWPRAVKLFILLLGLLPMVAAGLGYVGLSRFFSQQIVITGAIIVTMYLGFKSAAALADDGAFADTLLGQNLTGRYHLEPVMLGHIGVGTSVLINLVVLAWGLPLILLQWRFQWEDIRGWIISALTGFQVGTVTISLLGIFAGVLVFILGFALTRWFQRWLDGNILMRGKVDSGVRNSIKTALGYAGTALAGIIGISVAGIDLSNLALVAGALSLGIGFGLQNIVSNFVSGLILLAERPFKVGDWIEAGATSGIVKKISVRATEIETFHKQTVMLPNSVLINAAVGNWTHRNKLGRVDIGVGVLYKSDPKAVREILLEIGTRHPLVMKNPEPFVLFQGFGEKQMNFELRVHLADITNSALVQTDIRTQIMEEFAKAGIEIPPA
jgi:potassium-dependent mechanosensitive channel